MIVLDASFLCAWYNDTDIHHDAARDVMARFLAGDWGEGLLLEYVFVEVVTVLLARRGRDAAFEAARRLFEAREIELVPCSELFLDALEGFRSQAGRSLSFADAAMVMVARRQKVARIATFDRGLWAVPGLVVVPPPTEVHEGDTGR